MYFHVFTPILHPWEKAAGPRLRGPSASRNLYYEETSFDISFAVVRCSARDGNRSGRHRADGYADHGAIEPGRALVHRGRNQPLHRHERLLAGGKPAHPVDSARDGLLLQSRPIHPVAIPRLAMERRKQHRALHSGDRQPGHHQLHRELYRAVYVHGPRWPAIRRLAAAFQARSW